MTRAMPLANQSAMKLRVPYAFAALSLISAPARPPINPAEQKMIHTIDAEQQRTTDMLQRWVDQNSGTMNLAGVQAVRRMVEPEFKQLGFTTEWIDMKAAGRAGHLVRATSAAGTGKRLLLIAHLDTVFEPDSPFQRWIREGDMAHGPGAGDDKGGIAVIVAALRAMQAAGTLKNANITVFMTGDEEDSGNPITISRRDLIAEGKKADVALDFEDLAQDDGPNGPVDMGSIARRSAGSWTLTVSGRQRSFQRHRTPGVGYGAIYELARIIDTFRRELPEDKLTYNVGLIGGGQSADLTRAGSASQATGKTNIVAADRCCAWRPPRHQRGSDRAHAGKDARDRCAIASRHEGGDQLRRGRLSADAADGRQSRAACAAECGQPRHGSAADGGARSRQARRRRHQLRRRGR